MNTGSCQRCGVRLPISTRSHARFCSGACRAAANRSSLPATLRRLDRWVRWSPTKVPLQLDGRAASSTDPRTWSTYAQVRAHARKGFVLNGDGIVCLDLDHCLMDGVPTTECQDLLDLLPATYVEVSPGGDGLHVWGRGHLDAGRVVHIGAQRVECYPTGRYITVTGKTFRSAPSTLADLSEVLP